MAGLTVTACDRIPFLGGGSDGPDDVARSFWEAARAGDMELAQTFATGSESMSLNQPEGGETGITDVAIGTPTVDGERATVPTTLTNTLAGPEPSDLAINTTLVQVDGDWKVDLDETMDEVMRGIMGVSMTDMGQAMGEAVVGAMQGAADSSVAQPAPEQEAPPSPVQQTTPRPRQQPPVRAAQGAEMPWTPIAGTVSPGMSPEQVVAAWGQPVTERQYGQWMYMFFRNGCENRCGTFDVVFFQNGQVIDAVVRTPAHTYTGVSSSPPDNVAGFTPPSGGIGGY
jgi:hypothetical protein